MERIEIKAGYANGWTKEQGEIIAKIISEMENDPNTKKIQHDIYVCVVENHWFNNRYDLTWKVDSSD